MVTVNIAKLKAELSKYVKLAENGEDVVVTDHKKPVIRLVAIEKERRPRLKIIEATNPDLDLNTLKLPDPIPGLDTLAILMEDRESR